MDDPPRGFGAIDARCLPVGTVVSGWWSPGLPPERNQGADRDYLGAGRWVMRPAEVVQPRRGLPCVAGTGVIGPALIVGRDYPASGWVAIYADCHRVDLADD